MGLARGKKIIVKIKENEVVLVTMIFFIFLPVGRLGIATKSLLYPLYFFPFTAFIMGTLKF